MINKVKTVNVTVLMSYHSRDWFEHHVGFKESVEDVYKNIVVNEKDDLVEIESKINGRKITCGKFSIRSIDSFNLEPRNGGKLNIIYGKGSQSKRIEIVDVLQMQNLPEFNGATFLAASNFNCLEFPSHLSNASKGISDYPQDGTQGPAVAAAFGSILYRNYFIPKGKTQENVNDEINLLDNTPILVDHGKACISSQEEFQRIENFDFSNEKIYKIGIHENVEVTANRDIHLMYRDSEPGQFVHQVFASSFSISGYCKKHEKVLGILPHLLRAEYKLTILAAWENSLKYPGRIGSNKLVLTTLGTGAFHNPPDIVANSIKECGDLIKESGLDVYVVCFTDNKREGFPAIYPHLKNLIEETKGEVIYA